MLSKFRFPRIYYGWWIVISAGIITMIGLGFGYYGFSILFKPISSELGIGRAATSLAISIQMLIMGVMGPVGGICSDRFGPKWVIFGGVLWMAVTTILMFFITSFWNFILIWSIFCIGQALCVTIPTDKAIVSWFARRTGFALSIKFVITSCAGLVVLPVIAWLISAVDWRFTCVAIGLVTAVICIPLSLRVLKHHKPEYGEDTNIEPVKTGAPDQGNVNNRKNIPERSFTAKQTLKTGTFWVIVVIGYMFYLCSPIITVHSIPFLTDRGIDPVTAAGMLSVFITAGIPSRLIAGIVVDRLKIEHIKYIMVAGYVFQSIGILAFLFADNQAVIYFWFFLSGLGQGASLGVQFPMIARYFGRKAYGAIDGWRIAFTTPAMLLGPVYVGWIYDTRGSYSDVFIQFAVLLILCTVLSFFVISPKVKSTGLQVK